VIYTVIQSLTADGRDRGLDYKISGFQVPPGCWDAQVRGRPPPRRRQPDVIVVIVIDVKTPERGNRGEQRGQHKGFWVSGFWVSQQLSTV